MSVATALMSAVASSSGAAPERAAFGGHVGRLGVHLGHGLRRQVGRLRGRLGGSVGSRLGGAGSAVASAVAEAASADSAVSEMPQAARLRRSLKLSAASWVSMVATEASAVSVAGCVAVSAVCAVASDVAASSCLRRSVPRYPPAQSRPCALRSIWWCPPIESSPGNQQDPSNCSGLQFSVGVSRVLVGSSDSFRTWARARSS